MRFMIRRRTQQEGFGIVVVAMLFTAFAVVAAAALDRSSVQIEQQRQRVAEEQLSRLNLALSKFARYHGNRLPCPASWLQPMDNANFGSSVTASGAPVSTCSTGTYNPATDGVEVNGKLLFGMVPVRELVGYGVSYNDAIDPWGSRIVYVVHRDLTLDTTNAVAATASDPNFKPEVKDYLTGQLLAAPDALLVSYGRDRMGGRLRNQSSLASPSIACGGTRRGINCNNDRTFIRGPLVTTARAGANVYFDDTVSAVHYLGNSFPTAPLCPTQAQLAGNSGLKDTCTVGNPSGTSSVGCVPPSSAGEFTGEWPAFTPTTHMGEDWYCTNGAGSVHCRYDYGYEGGCT